MAKLSSSTVGLSEAEATNRLQRYGQNILRNEIQEEYV